MRIIKIGVTKVGFQASFLARLSPGILKGYKTEAAARSNDFSRFSAVQRLMVFDELTG